VSPPLFRGFLNKPCAEPTQGFNVSTFALNLIPHFQLITHTHTESGYFEVSNPAQSITPLSCVLPLALACQHLNLEKIGPELKKQHYGSTD
jgi:hypothetical protein